MTAPFLLLALAAVHPAADTTLRLPRGGGVEIETQLRDVIVRTGTTDMVTIRGATGEFDGRTLQVTTDNRRNRGNGPIEVTLPVWARVDVSSVGGNLTFSAAPERLRAETVNGFIRVTGGTGTVELETVAGAVTVTDFRGTLLSIDATGGAVTVTNATGKISVDNVNDNVTLRGIRSNSISASTVNGAIEYEGSFAADGRYEFNSQNDNVTLILPGDVSARLKISTMNGQLISPQIPATTNGTQDVASGAGKGKDKTKDKGHDHGDEGEHTFTAVYGSGAAQVTVDVFNGNVIVKRKP